MAGSASETDTPGEAPVANAVSATGTAELTDG
jgi:hypothetical protein